MTDDKKPEKEEQLPDAPARDLRVSGPLDLRLSLMDSRDRGVATRAKFGQAETRNLAIDQARFGELLENFSRIIDLPLTATKENSCTVTIGEKENAPASVTIELLGDGNLLVFSSISYYGAGISTELAARVELLSKSIEKEGVTLSTSQHNVFLCSQRLLINVTGAQLADWVADFYKRALQWRTRYSQMIDATITNKPDAGNAPSANKPDASNAPIANKPDANAAITNKPDADSAPSPDRAAEQKPIILPLISPTKGLKV